MTQYYSQICNRVIALDLCHNFVQNFISENDLIEFNQIFFYALILTRSGLGLFPVIFCKYVTELKPLVDVSAQYLDNKLRDIHQILGMHLY